MAIVQSVQSLISAWSIDFYAGWSIMDIFRLLLILTFAPMVINYFFSKAGGQ